MTRRLLASYLTITVIVLVMLMVPLGVFYSQHDASASPPMPSTTPA